MTTREIILWVVYLTLFALLAWDRMVTWPVAAVFIAAGFFVSLLMAQPRRKDRLPDGG